MSNIAVPNLPMAIQLDGTEELAIVQAGTSKRTTTGAVALVYTQPVNLIGSVHFAPSASSLVVTNGLVSVNSTIVATVGTNDATLKSVQAVAGAASFTLYGNAAATGSTQVNVMISY